MNTRPLLKSFSLTTLIVCLIACGPRVEKVQVSGGDSTSKISDSVPAMAKTQATISTTGLDIEPAIRKTDSLQILFFDNPDGDSLRYTRFYKYVTSGDSVFNHLLLSNLDKPFSNVSTVRDCRSEGKIYMYAGENPVKTLYFSIRGDSCSYIYMISNGAFLYFTLNNSVSNNLKLMKKTAKSP